MISSAAAPPVLWRDKQSYKAGKMIKGKYSIDTRRMRAKIRQWERQVDAATLADLKLYGQTAAKAMMKCTPPGNAKQAVGTSLKKLRERIREDFEGTGQRPFQEENLVWRRNKRGELFATFAWWDGERIQEGRPGPFRVYSGRVSKAKLAALAAGGRVEVVKNVGDFMKEHAGQYRMRRSGKAVRLRWSGVRHVASMAAVRKEMKARQRKAGRLMAGWKPLAHAAGTKLPAAVEKQSGKGSARIRRSMLHKAVLEGRNAGHYPELQKLVNRQIPWLQKRNRQLAKKRAKQLGKKLKK